MLLAWIGDRIAGVRALMRWDLLTRGSKRCAASARSTPPPTPTSSDGASSRPSPSRPSSWLEESGIHLIFNTPNPRSGAGYLSMGWGEVGAIGVMARPRIGSAVRPDGPNAPSLDVVAPGAAAFHPSSELIGRRGGCEHLGRWSINDGGSDHTQRSRTELSRTETGAAVVRVGVRNGRTELVLSDLLGGAGRRAVARAGASIAASYLAGFFSTGSPERSAAIRGGMVPVPGTEDTPAGRDAPHRARYRSLRSTLLGHRHQ